MNQHNSDKQRIRYLILVSLIVILVNIGMSTSLAGAQQLPNEQSQEEPPDPDIPPGYVIIEGDILVPAERLTPNAINAVWDTKFWPDGEVPFVFDSNVSAQNRTRMLDAMSEWENVANVDFFPRTNETNYIRIRSSTGNNSAVGMQGGEQIINIVSWHRRFTLAHELAHALGIWHEQSRPDRNSYVDIIEECVKSDKLRNFDRHTEADVYPKGDYASFGLTGDEIYDFGSVMHYGQAFFLDTNQPNCTSTVTIDVLPPYESWQNEIGQRDKLSELDQLTMSFLYPENNWLFIDSTYSGAELGDFINPYTTFSYGMAHSGNSGKVIFIQPGNYSAVGTYSGPVTLRAPLGNVVLGP